MQQLETAELIVKFDLKNQEQIVLYNWLNSMKSVMNACAEFKGVLEKEISAYDKENKILTEIEKKYEEIFLRAGINV